jgi:hypothetical protein
MMEDGMRIFIGCFCAAAAFAFIIAPPAKCGESEDSPLRPIVKAIEKVEEKLANGDTDGQVRIFQEEIIRHLDKLIEEAEKAEQNRQSSATAESNPPNPPKNSPRSAGENKLVNPQTGDNRLPNDGDSTKPKIGELTRRDIKKTKTGARKDGWVVNLPARVAEEAMDGAAEEYDEQYRELLEEYYMRLSESEENNK